MNKLADRLRGDYEAQVRAGKPASEVWAEAKEKVSLDRTRLTSQEMPAQSISGKVLINKTTNKDRNLFVDQALTNANIVTKTYLNDKGVFRTFVSTEDAERARAVAIQAEAKYYQAQQQKQAQAGMGMGIGL